MRQSRYLALAALLLAAPLLRAGENADEEAAKAVRAVLAAQVTAWNQGKLEKFMEGYWKSDELRFVSGKTEVRGWQALLDRYRKRYQADGKEMGKLSFSDLDVRAIGDDHALVYGKFRVETKGEVSQGVFTLVFKRLTEGWRIIHDHTSS
jgi:beta-aspartyl-peptidase (threonine type)